jgi:HlyD family secretion protein
MPTGRARTSPIAPFWRRTAKVSYFASEPQFTPPVIYSRDERGRLTFLAEATLDAGSALHPGQPVAVSK